MIDVYVVPYVRVSSHKYNLYNLHRTDQIENRREHNVG